VFWPIGNGQSDNGRLSSQRNVAVIAAKIATDKLMAATCHFHSSNCDVFALGPVPGDFA